MKLKKLAVIMSCTTLALAVSACSANKTAADTTKVQELNATTAQTTTDTQTTKEPTSEATETKAVKATPAETATSTTEQVQTEVGELPNR